MLQWSVLTLELWAREFLDRNPADLATVLPFRRQTDPGVVVRKAA